MVHVEQPLGSPKLLWPRVMLGAAGESRGYFQGGQSLFVLPGCCRQLFVVQNWFVLRAMTIGRQDSEVPQVVPMSVLEKRRYQLVNKVSGFITW